MKYLIAADIHFSNSLPYSTVSKKQERFGITDRFIHQLELIKEIGNLAERFKVGAVLLLGDIFDSKNPDSITLTNAFESIAELSFRVPIVMLTGNHDAFDRNTESSVIDIFRIFSNRSQRHQIVVCHEGFRFTDGGDVWIHALPWMHWDRQRNFISKFKSHEGVKNILLTHTTVIGGNHHGWTATDGFTSDFLGSKFHRVFTGHFHEPQKINNITYVGAPMHHHFGECGRRGVVIYDSANDEEVFVELDAPRFFDVLVEVVDGEVIERESLQSEAKSGDYLRYTVRATKPEFDRFVETMKKPSGVNVFVRNDLIAQHEIRADISDPTDSDSSISEYLKLANISGLDETELKVTGTDILQEARK